MRLLTNGIDTMTSAIDWDISVVVTTYNSVDALSLVLSSIGRQTTFPHEVIIADDGSQDETLSFVENVRPLFPFKLVYSWQPDKGFRLSRSRNLAALASSGNWLLFIDGDCLLPPRFIELHKRLIAPRCLIFGSRKLLTQAETIQLKMEKNEPSQLNAAFTGRKFWRFPLGLLRIFPRRSWRQFRGFLMGIDSSLYRQCAGFDESFRAWGLEDSDFAVRAIRAGGKLKDGRYANAVAHLFHSEPPRASKSSNQKYFSRLMWEQERFTPTLSIFLDDQVSSL